MCLQEGKTVGCATKGSSPFKAVDSTLPFNCYQRGQRFLRNARIILVSAYGPIGMENDTLIGQIVLGNGLRVSFCWVIHGRISYKIVY